MSAHTVKGFITHEKSPWAKTPTIHFREFAPDPKYFEHEVVVREHSITLEVPDDFNPIPLQVAGLEELKRLARLELASKLAHIDEQISKLTCIEHTVGAAS